MNRGAIALLLAACSQRAPLASCGDDLRGVYTAEGERWMMLDDGSTLEAYPLFPDVPRGATIAMPAGQSDGLVIAPRVIELARSSPMQLAGTVQRRYMQRSAACEAQVPAHVTRCIGDTIELVLADPAPPIRFAPCAWPGVSPTHVARWRRE